MVGGWPGGCAGQGIVLRVVRRAEGACRLREPPPSELPFPACYTAVCVVDLMEEVISDGEGEGGKPGGNGKKGHKGQKRKQQQEAPK